MTPDATDQGLLAIGFGLLPGERNRSQQVPSQVPSQCGDLRGIFGVPVPL